MITNIFNLGSNKRLIGASTITQQVVKNFLLTRELSLERKIKNLNIILTDFNESDSISY